MDFRFAIEHSNHNQIEAKRVQIFNKHAQDGFIQEASWIEKCLGRTYKIKSGKEDVLLSLGGVLKYLDAAAPTLSQNKSWYQGWGWWNLPEEHQITAALNALKIEQNPLFHKVIVNGELMGSPTIAEVKDFITQQYPAITQMRVGTKQMTVLDVITSWFEKDNFTSMNEFAKIYYYPERDDARDVLMTNLIRRIVCENPIAQDQVKELVDASPQLTPTARTELLKSIEIGDNETLAELTWIYHHVKPEEREAPLEKLGIQAVKAHQGHLLFPPSFWTGSGFSWTDEDRKRRLVS